MSNTENISNYYDNLQNISSETNSQLEQRINLLSEDNQKNTNIYNDIIHKQKQQENEISEKEKLILTRNRMLQIEYDKNLYKKRIIYSLIAFILFLIGVVVIIGIKKSK